MEYTQDWSNIPFATKLNIEGKICAFICVQEDLVLLYDFTTKEIVNFVSKNLEIDQQKTYENNHPWVKWFKKKNVK